MRQSVMKKPKLKVEEVKKTKDSAVHEGSTDGGRPRISDDEG